MPSMLKARGIRTDRNELDLPEGYQLEADNVNIDKDDTITPRRGLKQYGDELSPDSERVKQLMQYKDRLLRHYGSTVEFDDGSGVFTAFNGSYSELETGLRMKFLESNGNLFFTTSDGIQKISATSASEFTSDSGYIRGAGVPKALHIESSTVANFSGFLSEESKVAYRILWGYKDKNQVLVLGNVSERLEVTNSDATVDDVTFTGSGLDDATSSGNYTGLATLDVRVEIDGTGTPDTFKYSIDGGSTFEATTVAITGAAQELEQGIFITFENTTGHTSGDRWDFEVTNVSKNVTLTNIIPSGVDSTDFFYQVYRTGTIQTVGGQTVNDISPGDEMNLVYETNITAADISAGEVTFTDNLPDSFREAGAILYTNKQSGQGILQGNDAPPLAKDIATFNGYTFYANTKRKHKNDLTLLSVSELTFSEPVFTGSGSNDALFSGIYTEDTSKDYIIEIDAIATPDTFKWSDDGGSTYTTGVAITGAAQTLSNGISVTFVETTGHTLADKWEFTARPAKLLIGNDSGVSTYTFTDTTDLPTNKVAVSTQTSVAQAIDETARELVKVINRDSSGIVSAYYLSDAESLPGIIQLESRNLSDDTFYLAVEESIGAEFNPNLAQSVGITAVSTATNPVVQTTSAHGYSTGDLVYVNCTDSTPVLNDTYEITVIDADEFSIVETVAVAGSAGSVFFANEASDNQELPNGLAISKFQIGEAVPRDNLIPIGPKDSEIKRILALRDNLFILKDDGIYVLNGDSPANFTARLLDNSVFMRAPDAAAILNNQIYCVTSQGITLISDSGVEILRQLEDIILARISAKFPDFDTIAFATAYNTDSAYLLHLPDKTTDTYSTKVYRYNVYNNTWTSWTKDATCGIVNNLDDKLYLGSGADNLMYKERKDGTRSDYADLEYSRDSVVDGVSGGDIIVSTLDNVEVGDVMLQEQWVTIPRFNRLLRKIDLDVGLDTDYESTLEASNGDNVFTKLEALRVKLDADDAGYSYVTTSPTSFEDTEDEFNMITAGLNNSASDSTFKNYETISSSISYEAIVRTIVQTEIKVTLNKTTLPFWQGEFTLYKHYEQMIKWAPQAFGDTSTHKQVSYVTLPFSGNAFYSANIGFATDNKRSYTSLEFFGQGSGTFGMEEYGNYTWGGNGDDKSFGTIIPRSRQRCRFIYLEFSHKNARETFSVLGYSFRARTYSDRPYRRTDNN
jgi:hypothetical protein